MRDITRRRENGFTLAELLVTLAIGALLLSMAVPSYTGFVQNSRQITSANELLSTLHFARDLAITRNRRITVCPSNAGLTCEAVDWNEGWLVFADQDGDRQVDPGETIERVVTDVDALDMRSPQFDGFLIYRPSGRVMINNVRENRGEFTICDKRGADHARALIIDLSGRPRVSATAADGGPPVCPVLS